ncbi:MAG: UDP-N-acetylmuramate--L-alanine ligase [Oligoflexales bacterium]|nr:UDP-N-acetylmuramate--L-alanine ligase [Oligoflexales bacterium]
MSSLDLFISRQSEPRGHVHFIGIGGTGMGPLAELTKAHGLQVSGSDSKYSTYLEKLKKMGLDVHLGHDNEAIITNADVIVLSSAIQPHNIELNYAIKSKKLIIHRSDLLKSFLHKKLNSITVSGTNGKTTTTAMIAYLLHTLGKDPEAVVGASMNNFERSVLTGVGDTIVIESDESDGTFLKYQPTIGVITNIRNDHLDFYKNQDALVQAFENHVHQIHDNGTLITSSDDPWSCKLISKKTTFKKKIDFLSFGTQNQSDIQLTEYHNKEGYSSFTLKNNGTYHKGKMPLIGAHNIYNAMAALCAVKASHLDIKQAIESLESFKGVSRRLDLVYNVNHFKIYDDYAHNPSKIYSCTSAVKESWENHQLIVIFQPHRYSRLKTLYNEFINAFTQCHHVIVLPVYGVDEQVDHLYAPAKIANDIFLSSKVDVTAVQNFEEACTQVFKLSKLSRTIALTVGAGDIWKLAHLLKEKVETSRL